ncbi:hypothetical protein MJG53_001576 [Ovis ammon polii x Ovis aries]|uniref:Uncharacterized protein n=1 Tax=Ovis ammon polii x Ovis aries TaxID=2918886 RepID=A0ACB9VLF2_9CETA|nr:hypothetical protein MJG53_001576 [Ovis ammon polii x Ovis aries]
MLLWTALLFPAPVPGKPDLPKAVVNIQPAWINVLREDHVTLMCQGTSFYAGNLTMWFHNGSSIHTQNQPSYSFRANSNDSGSYRCQREQTSLSDPVHLDVISAAAQQAQLHGLAVVQLATTAARQQTSTPNASKTQQLSTTQAPVSQARASASPFTSQSQSELFRCYNFDPVFATGDHNILLPQPIPGLDVSKTAAGKSILDWLLLQTPSLVFQEGEPIMLRCHSWRNHPLSKITFYQDGKSKTFSYLRSNFSIPRANLSHSGQYHCTAFLGKTPHSSQPVNITVQAGLTDAETDAARTEAENTITYSLLSHPDVAEEDPESDYQKCL